MPEAQWKPPDNPDPRTIVLEAHADIKRGHYEDALAKLVWYHLHACRHHDDRLPPPLRDWQDLAWSYPPALEKLKKLRDEAEKNVLLGHHLRGSFYQMAEINRHLTDHDRTKTTFELLDALTPESAKEVYPMAASALVHVRALELCAKYVDPQADFNRIQGAYQAMTERCRSGLSADIVAHGLRFRDNHFINQVASLVAILAANGQHPEAHIMADAAKQFLNISGFARVADTEQEFLAKMDLIRKLDEALEGNPPQL